MEIDIGQLIYGRSIGDCLKSLVCIDCGRNIGEVPFRDEISQREYLISSLCQICQDNIFGGEEGEE